MHSLRIIAREGGRSEDVELLIGGKVVSWLSIVDLRWRIAGIPVPFGGIGGVGTDPAFRNRGLSRLCMDRALSRMREKGYPMTALFGIPDYYPKWGYVSVMPEHRLKLELRFAEESKSRRGRRVRPFDKARHGAAVLRIQARNDAGRMGSLVRPKLASWRPFRMGSWWGVPAESFVIQDAGGRILGYASHDKKDREMVVVEAGYADPSVFPDLTAELARRALDRRLSELEFCLPPDHPYADYLHRWNGEQMSRHFKNSQGMARILDLEALLRLLRPALKIRARLLGSRSWRLGLATDAGACGLEGRAGGLSTTPGFTGGPRCTLDQSELTPLLMGTRSAEEAAARPGVRIGPRARDILDALFPRAHPYMWHQDRF